MEIRLATAEVREEMLSSGSWRDRVLAHYGLDGVAPSLSTNEEFALFEELAQNPGSKEIQLRIIRQYLGLIISCVEKFGARAKFIHPEDLVSEVIYRLLKTVIVKYNHRRGYRFSTYLYFWIRREIGRSIDQQEEPIRFPAYVNEAMRKLYMAEQKLVEELQRSPTDEELAEAMGSTRTRVAKLREWFTVCREPISLDQPVRETHGDGKQQTLMGVIMADVRADSNLLARMHHSDLIDQILGSLAPKEERILRMRYGLDNESPMTLDQTAQLIGVTRERVRQIEHKALKKLRAGRARALLD